MVLLMRHSKDNYEPIDLDEDDKRSSHTILDIFAIIKQYVMTIKNRIGMMKIRSTMFILFY